MCQVRHIRVVFFVELCGCYFVFTVASVRTVAHNLDIFMTSVFCFSQRKQNQQKVAGKLELQCVSLFVLEKKRLSVLFEIFFLKFVWTSTISFCVCKIKRQLETDPRFLPLEKIWTLRRTSS